MIDKIDSQYLGAGAGAEPQATIEASHRSMELWTLQPLHVHVAQGGNMVKRRLWTGELTAVDGQNEQRTRRTIEVSPPATGAEYGPGLRSTLQHDFGFHNKS
jgi:hypothetical protein